MGIPEDILLDLHQRMMKTAKYKGHPYPEDVAHTYIERLLEGLHKKATVDQAFIDIVRLDSGRKGEVGYEAKKTK